MWCLHSDTSQACGLSPCGIYLIWSLVGAQTHRAFRDSNVCKWQSGTGAEDVEMGRCLMNLGVAAGDSRDELARSRFFPFPPGSFLIPGTSPMTL